MKSEEKNRIGEVGINKWGSSMQIIEYMGANDIIIRFNGGDVKSGVYKSFKIGNMKSVYDKTVCGVGYVGVGKYSVRDLSGKICRQYQTWRDMLRRCYDEKSLSKNPTYNKCTVCNEWLNYQIFAEWYDKNYYTVDNHKMHIDKDIMIKGNAEYNPSSCIFVPQPINSLFVMQESTRGDLPPGVHIKEGVIVSHFKDIWLGTFNNPIDAFLIYKKTKENYIKTVADNYKDKIPVKLYSAMYGYEVKITD